MAQCEQLGLIGGTITASDQIEDDLQAGVEGGEEHGRRPSYPSLDNQHVARPSEYEWTLAPHRHNWRTCEHRG